MACGALQRGSTPNCDTPFQGGNKNKIILIEKEDYDLATKTYDTLGRLATITMPSGKTAWPFSGFKNSAKPSYKLVIAPSGQSQYEHMCEYSVYEYSQTAKNNLQRKANGRYIGIIENNLGDANAFEVLGIGVGMQLKEMGRNPQDNGGAFKLILATPENEYEGTLPIGMLATDYAGTVAAIKVIVAEATLTNISPLAASAAGGTALTLTGTNFFGGGSNSAVLSIQYINQSTLAVVNQVTYTVASTVSITMTSVAMPAGSYKIRIITIKGQVDDSLQNLIVT